MSFDKKEYMKKWREKNKVKSSGYSKKWREKNKDHIKKYNEKWSNEHKDNRKKYMDEWHKAHYEEEKDKRTIYYNSPIGRATAILNNYIRNDKKYDRGKGDLTPQWIVENIFTKPCAHCGKTGWDVIGCNRLDNSKPHTKDNVEPCCRACNRKLQRKN